MSNSNDNSALFDFCLRLGDDKLIIGHRLSEWCGHAPILEEDIALANIALDNIGQASAVLAYAGELEGKGRTEDDLAYLRIESEYRNSLISEQPNGDFAKTIARQFFFDVYDYLLLTELKNSNEEKLAAIAAKSLKEATYHLRHSSQWFLRLADGTEESRKRLLQAIEDLWLFTGDMFSEKESDKELIDAGLMPSMSSIKSNWLKMVGDVFEKSDIPLPSPDAYMVEGSRNGFHTEHLGYILAEMQYIPRRYPDAKW